MFKKYVLSISIFLVILGQSVFAGNLLKNIDFSKLKKQYPISWGFSNYSGSQAELKPDIQIFHTTKPAMLMTKTNDKGWSQLIQTVKFKPLTQARKAKLSVWIYSEKTSNGSLVVMGDSAKQRNILWESLKSFSGTFEWKKIEGITTVPAGVICLSISIRLNKRGLIWVDDCNMEFLSEDEKKEENLLKNPELKGKINPLTTLPDGWQKKYVEGYENVSEIKSSESILQIKWKSGGAKFGAEVIPASPLKAGNYTFTAKCKTSGKSKAELNVGNYHSEQISSDSWKDIYVSFKVNSGENITPICWNVGQGEVQYKNFVLKATTSKVVGSFPINAFVMPVEITKIWKGEKEFNTFIDTPVPLSFEFKGDKNKFKKAALVLELPAELSIAEAYNLHTGLTQVEKPQITPIEQNGRKFNRYIFTNPRVFKTIQKDFAWERKLAMAIVPTKYELTEKSFPVYWYLTADNKKSIKHNFKLRFLPPLPAVNMPKNFPNYSWSLLDINFESPELLGKIADGIEKIGMNYRKRDSAPRYQQIDTVLKRRGWKFYMTTPDYYHPKFCGLEKSPLKNKLQMSINLNGSINKHKMCPSYFNTNQEFKKHFYAFLRKKHTLYGVENGDPIIFDIEPWQPMEWCFCEICRKDFAKKNNLKTVPVPKEISDKYSSQWSKFRCAQTAESIKMMAAFFRENYPKSKIFDYDYVVDFSNPDYRNYYKAVAKDPQLNEKYIDGHFNSYYHYTDKLACDLIDINIKNLKKDYYIVAGLDRLGYLNNNEVLSPARMRMLLLASAASGAAGFSVYPGEHFDGLYYQMFNQTMPLIAELEDTFKQGKRIDKQVNITALPYVVREIEIGNKVKKIIRPNWKDYFAYRAHQKNENITISLFNYNQDKMLFTKISLKMPKGKYTIMDVNSKKRLVPTNKIAYWTQKSLDDITAKVAPMNTTFLNIRKYKSADSYIPAISADSLNSEFARLKSKNGSVNIFKPVSGGDLKIGADDIDDNGEMEIVLSSKSQKIWINPSLSGAIVRWQYKGNKLFGWNTKIPRNLRILCADRFWLPKAWRGPVSSGKYEIKQTRIFKDTAVLELSKTFPDKGLVISKVYRLNKKSSAFKVEYSIKNIGNATNNFSFWVHSYPVFGNSSDVPSTAINLNLKSGSVRIFNQHIIKFYPFSAGQNPGFSPKNLGGIVASDKISALNPVSQTGISVQFIQEQLAGIYIWSSTNPTLEWIFKPAILPPGKIWKGNFSFIPFK